MSSPEDIEREIEQTRAEMTETLQAIERKLSPRHMMEQAMDSYSGYGTTRMVDAIRDNPLPIALVGIGLGWLVYSSMRESSASGSYAARSTGYGDAEAGEAGLTQSMRDSAGRVADRAGRLAEDLRGRASQTLTSAQESAARMASSAREQLTGMSSTARHQASQLANRSRDAMHDHPMMVGAMALAIGAAIGAALPRSRTEDEWLGHSRDNLVSGAREVGSDAWERGKQVAQRTAAAAAEEGREAYEHVKDVAKEEARRQDLTGSSTGGALPTGGTLRH